MARQVLDNSLARRLFLHRHALGHTPAGTGRGADLLELIQRLGFVQIDSVNTLARAHDMILFARRPAYRPRNLQRLIEKDRGLFEHWTHDASVIPVAYLPYWHLRFARDAARLRARWPKWQGGKFLQEIQQVRDHVAAHGEVSSAELKAEDAAKSTGWWDWHPSKAALEYLWRSGELAISRRQSFRKFYDLSSRVLGEHPTPGEADTLNWLMGGAIDRLGFATSGELAAFWDIASPQEAKTWCAQALASGEIEEIELVGHDGAIRRSYARP
ncbi:MAG: winged helix-turn-helix domain-containing protein, partial [Rhodobacteraceae bacterium]|nr:winged helix-turn-helix domain-containing protein [Paracoccaceae bacterium]